MSLLFIGLCIVSYFVYTPHSYCLSTSGEGGNAMLIKTKPRDKGKVLFRVLSILRDTGTALIVRTRSPIQSPDVANAIDGVGESVRVDGKSRYQMKVELIGIRIGCVVIISSLLTRHDVANVMDGEEGRGAWQRSKR